MHTTTSADSPPHGQTVQTATNPTACPVIQFDLYRDKSEDMPTGHVTIEEFIRQSEKDEERGAALEDARRWVGDSFYKGEGDSIRALRLKQGLSQAKLATLADTTQAHIARIEAGSTDCQVGTLQRVAKALGIDVLIAVKAFVSTREVAAKTTEDE